MIEPWKQIKKLNGMKLKTVSKGNPFDIVSVEENQLFVMPLEGNGERPIKKVVFENVYNKLREEGKIDLSEIRSFIEFSPVYVMAILETFPNIVKKKEGRKTILEYIETDSCNKANELYPDELDVSKEIFEGAKKKIYVNTYERNSKARAVCLAKHGYNCTICGMSFIEVYGEHGKDFIHVHHIVQLSKIGKKYKIDGEKDLIPVCPNCHAMLHYGAKDIDVEELKNIVKQLRD